MTFKEIVQSAGAMLFGLGLGVAALEIGVRTVADTGMQYELEMWKYALQAKRVSENPAIGHEHVPNVETVLMGVGVQTNEIGLRDDPMHPRTSDSLRVLMLGDSITFGWGVPQEETVAQRLEGLLSHSPELDGKTIDVVNAGVGNYNAAMSIEWYLDRGHTIDPDLIVFNYFINDAEPRPTRQGGWLRENSAAFVYFAGKVDTALRLTEERRDWRDYYRDLYREDAAGMVATRQAFLDLNNAASERSIPVIMAVYPELRELSPYPFQDVTDTILGIAGEYGWQGLDLLASVQDHPAPDLWVTVPDPHPNTVAAELFAKALAPAVTQQLTRAGGN